MEFKKNILKVLFVEIKYYAHILFKFNRTYIEYFIVFEGMFILVFDFIINDRKSRFFYLNGIYIHMHKYSDVTENFLKINFINSYVCANK